ncbi:MAG: hypothetical protein P4L57_02345 [Rhizomicrobium sp.]|nr:hypothetical protein [Rhizomicrobium sp.]
MRRARELSFAAFGSALWWVTEHLTDKLVENILHTALKIFSL